MLYPLVAWLVAALCVGVMLRVAFRIAALERPTVAELLARVAVTSAELAKGSAREQVTLAELDEQVRDIERESHLGPELPQGLARAALATGTAMAIIAAIAPRELSQRLVPAALSFSAGVAGAVAVALAGRWAKAKSREVRAYWSQILRKARHQIKAE